MSQPVVRAIDVGYGQVKFADGRDSASGRIRVDSFPSASPIALRAHLDHGVMLKKDNFIVQVSETLYEVGRDVHLAMDAHHDSDVMDLDFALSDAYAARLYGAISYMLPALPSGHIDQLVLGLPLNNYTRLHRKVSEKFRGVHQIGPRKEGVVIGQTIVYPQPLGSYAMFLAGYVAQHPDNPTPLALIVDVGYNTVGWFVCQGMKAIEIRSDATPKGMSGVLRAMARKLIQDTEDQDSEAGIVRRIDMALKSGEAFTQYGHRIDLDSYLTAASQYINEAAQAIRNSVGAGGDIQAIVVSGGGARLYASFVQAKYSKHKVVVLDDPAFANVRGFHAIGERLALSAQRATSAREPVGHE